jgi:hypothetical protein
LWIYLIPIDIYLILIPNKTRSHRSFYCQSCRIGYILVFSYVYTLASIYLLHSCDSICLIDSFIRIFAWLCIVIIASTSITLWLNLVFQTWSRVWLFNWHIIEWVDELIDDKRFLARSKLYFIFWNFLTLFIWFCLVLFLFFLHNRILLVLVGYLFFWICKRFCCMWSLFVNLFLLNNVIHFLQYRLVTLNQIRIFLIICSSFFTGRSRRSLLNISCRTACL